MFDKRLMQVCPESKKYIAGNIILQFLELCLNTWMILTIAGAVERLWSGAQTGGSVWGSVLIIVVTVILCSVTLLMGFGFFMMARKGIWITCIIRAVVWVTHSVCFLFSVKMICQMPLVDEWALLMCIARFRV